MSHLKPYPTYKPSGVEWLGDVPEHWDVKRFKFSAPLQSGKVSAKGLDLPYVGMENIESWTGKYVPNAEPDEAEGISNTFGAGDVLFGKLRPYLAKALLPDFDGLCSSELLVLRVKEMLPDYLLRFVLSFDFVNQVDASTYGTKMPRANWEFIGNLPATVPPIAEQSAIANFLDRETGRIDALVEKKRRFVQLLKEKRQALITDAVTGKFDVNTGKPYPTYKPSGVEWLGDVPEHWEVCRIKHIGKLFGGAGFPLELQDVEGEELYFYKVGDLSLSKDGKTLVASPHTVSTSTAKGLRAAIIPKGSIVYAKIGAALLLNRRRITTAACCIDNNMTAFAPDQKKATSDWAFNWLSIINFGEHVNPGAVPSLSEGYQSNLPALAPPLDEQVHICSYIDCETGRIDALVEKTNKSIDLLKERRSALITAVVTGKVDVREAA